MHQSEYSPSFSPAGNCREKPLLDQLYIYLFAQIAQSVIDWRHKYMNTKDRRPNTIIKVCFVTVDLLYPIGCAQPCTCILWRTDVCSRKKTPRTWLANIPSSCCDSYLAPKENFARQFLSISAGLGSCLCLPREHKSLSRRSSTEWRISNHENSNHRLRHSASILFFTYLIMFRNIRQHTEEI